MPWATRNATRSGSGGPRSACRTSPRPSAHSRAPAASCTHELALLLGVAARFGLEALVLDHVLGRLAHHAALVVVALAPGATGDLLNSRTLRMPRLLAVELAELGEQHRADRHVDADAERVGAADHRQLAGLRQRSTSAGTWAIGPRDAGRCRGRDSAVDLCRTVCRSESRQLFGERAALLAIDQVQTGQRLRQLRASRCVKLTT